MAKDLTEKGILIQRRYVDGNGRTFVAEFDLKTAGRKFEDMLRALANKGRGKRGASLAGGTISVKVAEIQAPRDGSTRYSEHG